MNPQYMAPPQGGGGFGGPHQGFPSQPTGYPSISSPPLQNQPPPQQSYPGMPTKTSMPSLNQGRPPYSADNMSSQGMPYGRGPQGGGPENMGSPPGGPVVSSPSQQPQGGFAPRPQQPPQPSQLAGQMASMTLNGHPQSPVQQQQPMGSGHQGSGLQSPPGQPSPHQGGLHQGHPIQQGSPMAGQGPPMPGQQGPPMARQQGPPMPGQQGPMAGQQGPPMPGQQGPPMPGQQGSPMPRQQGPPMSGQQGPQMSGQQGPQMSGQQGPPMSGQQGPQMSGQQGPQMSGQQGPPMSGQQGPQMSGQQGPQMSGQQGHPMSGQHGPPMPRQHGAPMPRPQGTSMLGQQGPPMPGQQGPPLPGQQGSHMQGQHTNMPGPQGPPSMTGFQGPQMSGQGPPMPGQGPPGNFSRYSSLNGAPPGQQVNGLPDTNGPGRPMQSRYPPMPDTPIGPGGYPPPGQQGGFPPQPQPAYPSQPNYPGSAQPSFPQQSSRRLDPDQMPSPMQVMEDDQKARSGIFYTNQKGQVPPLVTTDFIVQDQGNASPRFIRSTMYNVPINSDIMKQTSVPFGLVLSPMAEVLEEEQPPPLVDFGELGPVRCIRCKAYMCPFMQFIDGGRRFHCLLCKATSDVPGEYFQHLDHTGQRVDRFERAELVLGAYDIVATKEYCRDNIYPKPPALIFVIDVSYNNVKSGLVSLLCSQMRSILQNLPKEDNMQKSPMKVGFITYNNAVHFYNISPMLGQPQMLVVGDTQEMFMPLLDGFLVDPEESASLIDALMVQIPTMFADTRETETILAPAIQAGLEALKASGCAGKLLVFHSSLPIAEAPGKLKNRDDRSLLGTDKEKTILTPQNTVYNNLGQDCVGSGVSVDLFVTNNSFIDLATIGQVSRLTGGEVYKYTYFQADLDGERLISDVEKDICRLCAFDAIMRVRTSTGIRPTDFYGHFFMSNTTDIELASIDPDKGVALEIKHDDKLCEDEGVYIQAALLYTALSGQRRIRVINLALKACSQMSELYRTCELDTVINFFAKQSVFKLLDSSPKAVKDTLITKSAQILACYRKNCASPTSAGQLILPECMKLLPLYMNSLLKSDAISGGKDMTVDDRWFVMSAVLTMDIPSSLVYFYPRLHILHDMQQDDLSPPCIRCSSEKMQDNGVYLLDNGIYMFLWLGLGVASEWVMSVFGVPCTAQVDTDKNRLPDLDNPISKQVRNVISSLLASRHRTMRLTIVRQRDKMELVMKHFLVEDRGLDASSSYVDFLCHLHKEIRSMLS